MQQVSKDFFKKALQELGHDPNHYIGKRLSLAGMCKLYGLSQESVCEAIECHLVNAHYDYKEDIIWLDALDAAHFYFCVKSTASS